MPASRAKKKLAVYHGKVNISGGKVAAALEAMKTPFEMIGPEEIAAGRLADFAGVIFPGGHSIGLNDAEVAEVIRFVESGGGFLGICAGCQFGVNIGILPVTWKPLRASGIFDLRIAKRHPVTRGYEISPKLRPGRRWTYSNRGRVRCRYCNGGLLSVSPGADVLVSFDEEDLFGAIVAGRRGKGRAVLISSHPESTPPAQASGPFASDADRSQDPLNLFRNAVAYIGC